MKLPVKPSCKIPRWITLALFPALTCGVLPGEASVYNCQQMISGLNYCKVYTNIGVNVKWWTFCKAVAFFGTTSTLWKFYPQNLFSTNSQKFSSLTVSCYTVWSSKHGRFVWFPLVTLASLIQVLDIPSEVWARLHSKSSPYQNQYMPTHEATYDAGWQS